jgi:sec-independent protein translocase protein TatC
MPELVAEPEQEKQEGRQMGSMSLLQHLEELRQRIIRSLLAVVLATIACWWWVRDIANFIAKPVAVVLAKNKIDPHLVYQNPTDPFNFYLKIGIIVGLFIASPYVLYQLWMFISPGLYRNEKRFIVPFLFLSVGLFLAGGVFGYKIVFPVALDFLITTYGSDFKAMITIGEYSGLFLSIILGLSIIFELPIVISFLAMMGVVNAKFLFAHIRGAILIFFIIAAVLTPTTDILNMTIYAAPMIMLYLLSIGLAWLVHPQTRRRRAERRKGQA